MVHRSLRPALGLTAGALTVVLLHAAGSIAGARDALVVMGFDPDRARLLAALTVGAMASAAATLVTAGRLTAIAVSIATLAGLFGRAFLDETAVALRTGGANGFDPGGWLATAVTLAVAGLVTGWAAGALALEVRGWFVGGAPLLVRSVRERRIVEPRRSARAALAIGAVFVTFAALPTFSDMVNYTPDVAMTSGGIQAGVPLVGPAAPADASPSSMAPSPAGGPGQGSASAGLPGGSSGSAAATGGPIPAGVVPASAISPTRPWLSSVPAGTGTVVSATLPSPWVGGHVSQSTVWAYLPAGYASGAARYPVIYAVPWDLAHWQLGARIGPLLDQQIASGGIPPVIVVFVDLSGGVFPVSECANSYNGVEFADTYVSRTVVAWADRSFRTIATPAARTILGFSQGGFCAANLLVRHPDVFGNAAIFSGYFVAGLRSGDTVNAWRPFGMVPSVIAANSPIEVAPTLPAATRHRLFVVLSATPTEPIYGPQATAFVRVLERSGVNVDVQWTQLGHAWISVRTQLASVLRAVAARMVATGVLR